MEKVKASPGPYLVAGTTVYALDETGKCNRFTAHVQPGFTRYHGGGLRKPGDSMDCTSVEEAEAVARLFAASADLYSALQTAESQLVTLGGDPGEHQPEDGDQIQKTVLWVVREAMKKAREGAA